MGFIDISEIKKKQNKEESYINMLVSRKRIEWIALNFKLSTHAQFRLVQRDTLVERNLKLSIRRSPLCWKSIEGTICIAFDLYNYIVVDDRSGEPIIATFVDTRDKKTNVWEVAMVEYKKFVAKSKGV